MQWIYDNLLAFAIPLATFWFFIWLCKSYSASGRLFTLRQHLTFERLSTIQKDVTEASYYSTSIDGASYEKYDSNILSYYGTDQNRNMLFIKINRRQNKPNELVLFLRLEDGRSYELPDHPNTVINNVEDSTWSADDLKISVLQSTKRTRIVFNGLLRRGNRMDVNYNSDDDIVHVRFNCIFIAHSKPYPQKEYWGSNLLAETMKRNFWSKYNLEQFFIQVGHVKDPRDDLHPVESMKFNADQLFDCFNNEYDEFALQFSTENKKYEALIKLQRKTVKSLYGGDPWDSQYTYCHLELKLNDNEGFGMIEIRQPYIRQHLVTIPIPKKMTKWNRSISNEWVYTIPFYDETCRVEGLVGGKGVSLSELTAIKTTEFTVPKGFCVTSNALDAHVKCQGNLMEIIDEFVEVCCGKKDGDVKDHSQKVVVSLQSTPMLDTVQAAIMETFKKLESVSEKHTYAVRSSAVGEDSEDTSAAGQNSTFLGIKSADEVIKYVAHCWASLYTHQSIEYRRQHGLPIKASMGVCVQQMVNAEAAGVLFTRHPITGNPKEILITSNYGLGESVVSALVDPDTIIIHRNQKNSLSVKSSTIGKKSQKITVNSGAGGTVHSDVSENEKSKLSISEDLAIKLAEIGVTLDQSYNAPRDIEWAISKGQIYLLQCRPVTALDAWTEFELTHELGSGVPSDSVILTRANVGEVFPRTLTPLTVSTIVYGFNISMERMSARQPVDDAYKHHMFVVNWKTFLNYTSLFLLYVEEKPNLAQKIADIALCGHTIITPKINETSVKRNGGAMKLRERIKFVIDSVVDLWNNSRKISRAERIVERWKSKSREARNLLSERLHEWLGEVVLEYVEVTSAHSHATRCNIFCQVIIASILAEGSAELTMEHCSDVALLLGSCSDVVSSQVPVALKEITRTIKVSGLSEDFKRLDPSKALPWLLNHCPKAHEQVQKFIEVHGHRGIEEYELITETWGMRPEKFLSTVQSMLNSNADKSTKSTELSPREAVSQMKTPRIPGTRWIISQLLPWMRRTVSQREKTKCLLIEMVHLMRLGYRNLSEILVREGRLPERELIFFFTHEELADVVRAPCPNLIRKAVRRRKLRPKLEEHEYDEINHGMPMPIEVTKVPTSASGVRVQGTSVCNGVATGRVCVALSLEEAAEIRPGDILITHATDIGWSPYFPLLAGVVTELGGLISHGAIIAREYGLPCIVSTENATAIFKTGDIVRLDGCKGTIEVHEEVHPEIFK